MIPKWIADIFKTEKEKRSEQDQLDLDRYVADTRFTDPEKYERLQHILKHTDPDTGHLPTGLNTGNIDESVFDDIKASKIKFTNWEYKDPKNPAIGRRILAKGRSPQEAALYVTMRYPQLSGINPRYFEDTGKVVSLIDDYIVAIYNGETEAPEKGETPYFMKEAGNKMNKKDLMEMIREVIAEESTQTTMGLEQQGTVAYITPAQRDKLIDLGSVSIDDLKKLGIEFRSDRDDVEFDNNVMYKVHGGSGPNPGVKLVSTGLKKRQSANENKTKMKVNQLKQIIREEISKIIKEETAPVLKGDTSTLVNNFKKLNIPGFDPGKITTTIMLVKQNKVLNTAANKVLADIMTAMIKTSDDALLAKIFSNLKNIEAPNPE